MKIMNRLTVACSVAMLLLATMMGCKRASGDSVPVKILYDPQAVFHEEISSKLQAYSAQHPMTSKNKIIEVHEVAPGGSIFHGVISGTAGFPVTDADIVILDPQQPDLSDKVKQGMATAKNACAPPRSCMAFIGSWIPEDRREAAQSVLNALTTTH